MDPQTLKKLVDYLVALDVDITAEDPHRFDELVPTSTADCLFTKSSSVPADIAGNSSPEAPQFLGTGPVMGEAKCFLARIENSITTMFSDLPIVSGTWSTRIPAFHFVWPIRFTDLPVATAL